MSVHQISVIIPTFNSENTIRRTVQSVLDQTVLPFEIIIIDDCSTDQTVTLVQEITFKNTHVNFTFLKNEKNQGPSFTRNRGILIARGNWIAFLDSDDFWHPQKLEIQLRAAATSGLNLIGSQSLVSTDDKKVFHFTEIQYRLIKPWDMLWKNYFQTPTVLIKKTNDLIFNEAMSYAEDFDLWMRMIHKYQKACLVTLPLTYLGKEPYLDSGLSHNLLKMEMGELLILKRERNYFLRIVAVLFSVLKFIRRLLRVKLRKI